jgi:CubicO group peptidase (beta-lactamase class C family)
MIPISIAILILPSAFALCPPSGPVLPPPQVPTSVDLSSLKATLNKISNGQLPKINATTNSFSVQITDADGTFFDHHHTAPLRNSSGVEEVDGNTIYRIASVTKVFTVLAALLESGLNLEDPIGKYVPELKGSPWESVSLRLLTSQLSALPRDGMVPVIALESKL